ncbi:hypothetical protein SCHPADRAFT_893144 [Schizopora paradoxa]|uniref:Uncharacterized protein n=1 Tax=Schizopora paradoxa TaxID=27342 RepID=A0A0H2RIY2_9AGAM|nr:hypothetical protein SCHPADRAFT_893144 [Schizopora paradoxa]
MSIISLLPIERLTYTAERSIVFSGDVVDGIRGILEHLDACPTVLSSEDCYWTVTSSKDAHAQAKVKAMLKDGNISQNNAGFQDRIPGRMHMIKRPISTGTDLVFFRESLEDEVKGANIRLFKISIPFIEFAVAFNTKSYGLTLQVFLQAPIIGAISVGSISGSLNDGLKITVGYPGILGGVVTFTKVSKGSKTLGVLGWDLTVFGKSLKDTINVFEI